MTPPANGRDSSSNPSYYVISQSTVAAASGQTVTNGAFYLGRPWRNYSRVVFQNTRLSPVINGAGWHIWNTGQENTDHVYYGEYGNTGPGANGTRVSFETKLSKPVNMSDILGSSYANASYYDAKYM
jgi:pectinesterase